MNSEDTKLKFSWLEPGQMFIYPLEPGHIGFDGFQEGGLCMKIAGSPANAVRFYDGECFTVKDDEEVIDVRNFYAVCIDRQESSNRFNVDSFHVTESEAEHTKKSLEEANPDIKYWVEMANLNTYYYFGRDSAALVSMEVSDGLERNS